MIGRLLVILAIACVGQVMVLSFAGVHLVFLGHMALGAILGTVAICGYILGHREQINA